MNHSMHKKSAKTRQENTGDKFLGNQQRQQPNLTMAATHHNLCYEGMAKSIVRDTTTDQWGITRITPCKKLQQKQGRRTQATIFWAIGNADGKV